MHAARVGPTGPTTQATPGRLVELVYGLGNNPASFEGEDRSSTPRHVPIGQASQHVLIDDLLLECSHIIGGAQRRPRPDAAHNRQRHPNTTYSLVTSKIVQIRQDLTLDEELSDSGVRAINAGSPPGTGHQRTRSRIELKTSGTDQHRRPVVKSTQCHSSINEYQNANRPRSSAAHSGPSSTSIETESVS